jgi:hypothetical protein
MYGKWFHWILNEFTDDIEQDLMGHNGFKSLVNED